MDSFIKEQGLFFEGVDSDRKAALRSKLLSIQGAPQLGFDGTTYYRIPFWQAADLIGKRQVCWFGAPPPPMCVPALLGVRDVRLPCPRSAKFTRTCCVCLSCVRVRKTALCVLNTP